MTPSLFRPQRSRTGVVWGIIGVFVILCLLLWLYRDSPWLSGFLGARQTAQRPIATSTYTCDAGKTLTAAYYTGEPMPQATGDMPRPTGKVVLTLDDGRKLTLPQTISASGVRYANADESFVFWSKGNTAFIEEGGDHSQTYAGCVTGNEVTGQEGWSTYATSTWGLAIQYPQAYSANDNYTYTQLGPGKGIDGVKLTIPASKTTGTNLSKDSGISVEVLPKAATCSASAFLPTTLAGRQLLISDHGVDYLFATSSDAGAGNRYEEIVYAIRGSTPCTAVRYFIHSTAVGNYEPGTVVEFDRQALLQEFDQIRQSLTLAR